MENFQVALRVRPATLSEIEANDLEIWTVIGEAEVGISKERYSDLVRLKKIPSNMRQTYSFGKCPDLLTFQRSVSIKRR